MFLLLILDLINYNWQIKLNTNIKFFSISALLFHRYYNFSFILYNLYQYNLQSTYNTHSSEKNNKFKLHKQ